MEVNPIERFKIKKERGTIFENSLLNLSKQEMIIKELERIKNNNIIGDTAEVGCYGGGVSKYIANMFPEKKHFAYDTFNGIPNAVKNIDTFNHSEEGDNPFGGISFKWVKEFLNLPNIKIRKGIFPNSVKKMEMNRKYCFVHIDGDTYKTTIDGLEFYFNKIVSGGVIIVDDYGNDGTPGVTKAIKEFCNKKNIKFHILTPGQCKINKIIK